MVLLDANKSSLEVNGEKAVWASDLYKYQVYQLKMTPHFPKFGIRYGVFRLN